MLGGVGNIGIGGTARCQVSERPEVFSKRVEGKEGAPRSAALCARTHRCFSAPLLLSLPSPSDAPPGGDDDPYLLSWRGIDSAAYYMQDPEAYVRMLNYRWVGGEH